MSERSQAELAQLLEESYSMMTKALSGRPEADFFRPSRCAGWAIQDVLFHQLLDLRRALRTFVSPAEGPPDIDDVTYWEPFAGGMDSASGPGGDDAARHARYVRVAASAYEPEMLMWEWRESAAAAARSAAACSHPLVATQGHVLTTADFMATLVVESTVHYLDLTVDLDGVPEPLPEGLDLVLRLVDALLGAGLPAEALGWQPVAAVLKSTGRSGLTAGERATLGALAGRFPVFG